MFSIRTRTFLYGCRPSEGRAGEGGFLRRGSVFLNKATPPPRPSPQRGREPDKFVFGIFLVLAFLATTAIGRAEEHVPEPAVREIFVPFADLHVILAGEIERVFMSREEYEALVEKAKQATKPAETTQPAAVLSADYTATIEENRARIVGNLVVTAPDDNLSAVELDLSGVALRSATLDERPAPLGRNPAGLPVLFVSGAGRHELRLEILAPVETATAQRTFSFQVPTPPAARLRLTVPGNVEIKSGATIIERNEDAARQQTVFELLPRRRQNNLVMSLNNRQLQKDRIIVAHSVLFDEITTAYEQLHVTMSLSVLHGAAEQFQFEVPAGFEVLSVQAPQVARWAVSAAGDRNLLEVTLHEPTSETVSLNILAVRSPAPLEEWNLPKLKAMDVVGQAAVIGLLIENRLKPRELRPHNLISIDAEVLSQAMPESFSSRAAGRTSEIALAAFYAPQVDYDLQASFAAPPAELLVTTGVFLSLAEKSLDVRGSFGLVSVTEKLLGFEMIAPAGWQVTEVTLDGGAALSFESFAAADGASRVQVKLPQSVSAGELQTVFFQAIQTPEGWLDDWQTKQLAFPVFRVLNATRDFGAIAIQARDDMRATADQLDRLTPLDANEKGKYGLSDVPTEMAYRYDAQPFELKFTVARLHPRSTARVLSFFRFDRDLLTVHDEIVYEVSEARTSRLSFALPHGTPAEIAITGLDGVAVKESSSEVSDGLRAWTVQLAEPRVGPIRLAIDFQQPVVPTMDAGVPPFGGIQSPPKDGTPTRPPKGGTPTIVTLPIAKALEVA